MAISLDEYPNSYDLMAIEPIEEILISQFCDIEKAHNFQSLTLEEKNDRIREIALHIDQLYLRKKN